MNSGVIHVLSRPAADAAHPHHLSKRAVHGDFKNAPPYDLVQAFLENAERVQFKNRPRSGDHQHDRPDRPGKNPSGYAVRRRSVEKSPPTATSPRASRPARIRKGYSDPSKIGVTFFTFVKNEWDHRRPILAQNTRQ